jgi:hypothetical protein
MANSEQEKQQKKEHIARSLGKFNVTSTSASLGFMNSDERKQRIMDHIRLTRG